MSGRRVVITGMGVVSGYGRGPAALWSGLASGRSAVREHEARLGRHRWHRYLMASVPGGTADLAEGLPNQAFLAENRLREDPDFIAIADCVRQAILDARLAYEPERNDIGLVLTHESPGLSRHIQDFFRWADLGRTWLRSPARFNPPEFLYQVKSQSVYGLHSFLYLHYMSALFQLHGFTLYNNNACSSGAFALAVAADRIRSGEADAVIVAGGDVPEDGTKYRWFKDLDLYSRRGECRPFAKGGDGLVLGSGAAAFVLEDREAALASGKRLHAEWLGGGFSSDGWKVTLPDPAGGRYAACIERALRSAGVVPGQIGLVTPHGVGSTLYDRFEAASLVRALGDGAFPWPPLMALKGAIGHTLGGCVLLETAASLLALERGVLPQAAVPRDLDPALPMRLPEGDRLPNPWVLLKCTNGFAGQNGAIVLRSAGA